VVGGRTVAETRRGLRVLETSHPPTYYFPPEDVDSELLRPGDGSSWCEWKGRARWFSVVVGDDRRERIAWCYPDPTPDFVSLRDFPAFMASLADECRVDGELARPQRGGFYGGWITSDLAGPFKGEPGSAGW
jgi:uncharacterized protein (DUF427 family)